MYFHHFTLKLIIKTEPMDQFPSNVHPFFRKGSSYEKYKKILKIDIIRDHVTKNVTRVKKELKNIILQNSIL